MVISLGLTAEVIELVRILMSIMSCWLQLDTEVVHGLGPSAINMSSIKSNLTSHFTNQDQDHSQGSTS